MTHTGATFGDTLWARLIALGLGALIAWALWASWGAELTAWIGGESAPGLPGAQEVKPANPALAACLEKRLGDVDGMLADGVIGAAQAEAFKARASELCQAQNAG